ncbi:MAG: response regulator transcription factor [Desulfobacterales bacterium]|nr:response regulator transcription factor [Desulfobacterales bacterium]
MKILIAEDDLAFTEFIKKSIEKFGECITVDNGAASITAFMNAVNNNDFFDLIIHDIEIPRINGLDAIAIIRQIEKVIHPQKKEKTKIIVISGHSDKDNVIGCFKAGCDKYIVKPFDIVKLFAILESLGIK